MYQVIEKFISIDGEGPCAGQLAAFIRFKNCNLRCDWCDTCYSYDGSVEGENLSPLEIYHFVKENKVNHVTLTGGEPLIQPQIEVLIGILAADKELTIHIETNGSVNIQRFKKKFSKSNVVFILDYKLPNSLMQSRMDDENFKWVTKTDVYKFVIASQEDLKVAHEVIREQGLLERCLVYFSPVVDYINTSLIVDYMKDHQLNDVRLQLQLHKYIWPKEMRGV